MRHDMRIYTGAFVLFSLLCFTTSSGKAAVKESIFVISPDVLIDVGHGGIDGGTSHGDILEKDINLAIARKVFVLLQKDGLKVAMDRTGDYALSDDNVGEGSRHRRDLVQRKIIADQLSPRLMMSFHVNWSGLSKRSGAIVLFQNNRDSVLLASFIQQSLNRLYNSKNRPQFGKTFYLLNHCQSPTVIVEIGFLSNESDRKLLTSNSGQKKLAQAIASAAEQYLLIAKPTNKTGSEISALK